MSIVILLISFITIFLYFGISSGLKIRKKELLLRSVLVFSFLIVVITEFASTLHLLNFQFILLIWVGVLILSSYCIFSNKEKLINFTTSLYRQIKVTFIELNKFEKFLFFSVIIILVLVFIQGIVYPPNNWDSMNYHLARIPNWISHQSVEHYPTHIFRQLYQPPFSEYVIMHFNILNSGDYFSNSVQLFYLVFTIFGIVLVTEIFEFSRRNKLVIIVLVVTIPEAILQASSTQNDIVVSFFIVSSIYFAIKSVKEVNLSNFVYLGLSVGLALLTKGTAYIYIAPVLLFFGVAVLIYFYRTVNYLYLFYSIVTVLIVLSINSGHYIRNYNLSNNILGVNKAESKMYANEKMDPTLFLSICLKNTGLHIGPNPINNKYDAVIRKLHSFVGLDINNLETSFSSSKVSWWKYTGSPDVPNGEDDAPNTAHFYLILISLFIISLNILKNKKVPKGIALYIALILLQSVLFCYYLKFQPWHSRLHMPLFIISVLLIGYAIRLNEKYINILFKLIPIVVIVVSSFVIVFNRTRPYISNKYTNNISITDSRYKKYFATRLYLYNEYKMVVEGLNKSNCSKVGLILGSDQFDGNDWEYPLFCQFYSKDVKPIHINVTDNISKNIPSSLDNVDCIVSTVLNNNTIDFHGKNFVNQTSENKKIWLYK